MIYKLTLGDWSEDGHGVSKDILINCNCDNVADIQNAYKVSCKKLGVQFNDETNDYTEKNLQHNDPRLIWTNYQENDMSVIAHDILNKAGCFDGIDVKEYDKRFYIESQEQCARIIMNFISISMPDDFTYKIVKENYPYINGHWSDNLNIEFGYGLFDRF